MSSAFKNFFITFAVSLLVFGFVGLKFVYPWLKEITDLTDMGEESTEEVSTDASEDVSPDVPPIIDDYDENGDVFRAVVVCVDDENSAVAIAFISSNAKSKQYIYCPISPSTRITNELGVPVSCGDFFGVATPEAACQMVSAMTGLQTDYCLKFKKENMESIAKLIPGASVALNETIQFKNPKYEDYVHVDGAEYPSDYYLNIANVDGKVSLTSKLKGTNKTNLAWLLEYNPNEDGTVFNSIYASIARSLLEQFFSQEASTKSTRTLATIIANSETNLTADAASEHLETIFSRDEFTFHTFNNYPGKWENVVPKFRALDGTR